MRSWTGLITYNILLYHGPTLWSILLNVGINPTTFEVIFTMFLKTVSMFRKKWHQLKVKQTNFIQSACCRRSHSLLSCICGNAAALPETQLRAAGAAARSQRIQSSNSKYYRQYGSPKAQWTIYWTQVTQPAQPAQLVQLRAANAASASRAPIRSTIGSMGPQKPNEQYIERRWRSRRSQRSQRSWCSCAQPTQPAHPELQFEVL